MPHVRPSATRRKSGAGRHGPVATAFAVAVLTLAGCAAVRSAEEPAAGDPMTEATALAPDLELTTLAQETVPGGWGERLRRVVRDEASWQATWAELLPGPGKERPPAAVDFERSMVIAAALPTQHCDGRITVRRVRVVDGELAVDLLEELADPRLRCFVATRPFHAVLLTRRDGEARFSAESRTYRAAPRS